MQRFNPHQIVDRSGSLSLKYNRQALQNVCGNPDAMPFWVADMDWPIDPAIGAALEAQVRHGVLGYAHFANLGEIFSQWALKRHNWSVKSSAVITAPGMIPSITLLVELFSRREAPVIVQMPSYKPFVILTKQLQRELVQWPFTYEGNTGQFTLDLALLEQLCASNIGATLILCSPHNPTGYLYSLSELLEIAQIAARYNILVISDEIHSDLAYSSVTHIPFDIVAREVGCRAATCMAPSKTFNIAGEHFSVIVCSDSELQKSFQNRLNTLSLRPTLLSTVVALTAYQEGYPWLVQLIEHLEAESKVIANIVAETLPTLRFIRPQASFIALLDCTQIYQQVESDRVNNPNLYSGMTGHNEGLLAHFFGQRAQVAMNDGSSFGSDYHRFVRFNFGTSPARVEKALAQMAQVVNQISSPIERK